MEKMREYYQLLDKITRSGYLSDDRTGVGTKSLFGEQMKFNLQNDFPLLGGKKLHVKSIIHELLWLISGNTNIKYLKDNDVSIWDEWANENGDLGPVYGKQWRHWNTYISDVAFAGASVGFLKECVTSEIDQLADVIKTIKTNANSRRMIVTAWNPAELREMALEPCHMLFQFYVRKSTECEKALNPFIKDYMLSCRVDQRSADMFLGVPFNIASYAALTYVISKLVGMTPDVLTFHLGNAHIYNNHVKQVEELLSRTAIRKHSTIRTYSDPCELPKLIIKDRNQQTIDDFIYEDFEVINYKPMGSITAPVAI